MFLQLIQNHPEGVYSQISKFYITIPIVTFSISFHYRSFYTSSNTSPESITLLFHSPPIFYQSLPCYHSLSCISFYPFIPSPWRLKNVPLPLVLLLSEIRPFSLPFSFVDYARCLCPFLPMISLFPFSFVQYAHFPWRFPS